MSDHEHTHPRDVRAGIYQHYKGDYYLVLGLAHHSETMETFVVYVPLYVREGPRMCVRPVKMFFGDAPVPPCPECSYRDSLYLGHAVWTAFWRCRSCKHSFEAQIERFRYIGAEMPGEAKP